MWSEKEKTIKIEDVVISDNSFGKIFSKSKLFIKFDDFVTIHM